MTNRPDRDRLIEELEHANTVIGQIGMVLAGVPVKAPAIPLVAEVIAALSADPAARTPASGWQVCEANDNTGFHHCAHCGEQVPPAPEEK